MAFRNPQHDISVLLHQQQQFYVTELGRNHKTLSKQYKKLARIQSEIDHRQQTGPCRPAKKKLQFTRAIIKKDVDALERQQEHLRHCLNMVASYDGKTPCIPLPSWTTYPPPMIYPSAPLNTLQRAVPWTAPSYQLPECSNDLRHKTPSSRCDRPPSADSGFCEPSTHSRQSVSQGSDSTDISALDQVHIDEATACSSEVARLAPAASRETSASSGQTEVPQRAGHGPCTRSGTQAAGPRQRRYSEDAIRLIEHEFGTLKIHQRGRSEVLLPTCNRTLSSFPG